PVPMAESLLPDPCPSDSAALEPLTPERVGQLLAFAAPNESLGPDAGIISDPSRGSSVPPDAPKAGSREEIAQTVDCAVFAPPQASPGSEILVQVFAYLAGCEGDAERRALLVDDAATI